LLGAGDVQDIVTDWSQAPKPYSLEIRGAGEKKASLYIKAGDGQKRVMDKPVIVCHNSLHYYYYFTLLYIIVIMLLPVYIIVLRN
jgi:hypothetical protein